MSQGKDSKYKEKGLFIEKDEINKVSDWKGHEGQITESIDVIKGADMLDRCVKSFKYYMFQPLETEERGKVIDEERNNFAMNEKKFTEKEEIQKNLIEVILKLVSIQEKKNFDPNLKGDTIIDEMISQIQKCQKKLYDPNNKVKMFYYSKCIEMYLFMVYIIIKNYPFYIQKRELLEKYFIQLMPYKK